MTNPVPGPQPSEPVNSAQSLPPYQPQSAQPQVPEGQHQAGAFPGAHSQPQPQAGSAGPVPPQYQQSPTGAVPQHQQAGGQGQYQPALGQFVPAAPARPATNPFVGMPVSDLVRDGLAFLLFLVSLALPWDRYGTWSSDARERDLIEVLLICLLSAFAVAVPYFARANTFPASWTNAKTRLLRLVLAAPFVVLVLVHFVLGAVSQEHRFEWGTGVMFGLAAAVLLAQPRSCELSDDEVPAAANLWKTVYTVLLAVIAGGSAATLVWGLISGSDYFPEKTFLYLTLVALSLLISAAIVLFPGYMAVLRDSVAWRRALVSFGIILTVVSFFGLDDESTLPRLETARPETLSLSIVSPLSLYWGLGFFLVPALAAIASSAAIVRSQQDRDPGMSWIRSAGALLWLQVAVAASFIVTAISLLLSNDALEFFSSSSKTITTLVLALIAGAAAAFAAIRLTRGSSDSRLFAVVAVSISFIVGIICLVVAPSYGESSFVTFGHLAFAFGIPLAVAYALFVPRSARERFASLRPANAVGAQPYAYGQSGVAGQVPTQQTTQSGQYVPNSSAQPYSQEPAQPYGQVQDPAAQSYGAPANYGQPVGSATGQVPQAPAAPHYAHTPDAGESAPVQHAAAQQDVVPVPPAPVPVQPTATHSFTAQQARDPQTSGEVLAKIVQEAPELRADVAANPATYPALLDWLRMLNDPQINAALDARGLGK